MMTRHLTTLAAALALGLASTAAHATDAGAAKPKTHESCFPAGGA